VVRRINESHSHPLPLSTTLTINSTGSTTFNHFGPHPTPKWLDVNGFFKGWDIDSVKGVEKARLSRSLERQHYGLCLSGWFWDEVLGRAGGGKPLGKCPQTLAATTESYIQH